MSKEPTTNSQGLSEECHAMISRISHEVRNPVAVIHSFHQLLLLAHPELSNDLYFQKIQENMAFLNSLLDELSCYKSFISGGTRLRESLSSAPESLCRYRRSPRKTTGFH